MHKFFILIHLLHSSTCFEHCCARNKIKNLCIKLVKKDYHYIRMQVNKTLKNSYTIQWSLLGRSAVLVPNASGMFRRLSATHIRDWCALQQVTSHSSADRQYCSLSSRSWRLWAIFKVRNLIILSCLVTKGQVHHQSTVLVAVTRCNTWGTECETLRFFDVFLLIIFCHPKVCAAPLLNTPSLWNFCVLPFAWETNFHNHAKWQVEFCPCVL